MPVPRVVPGRGSGRPEERREDSDGVGHGEIAAGALGRTARSGLFWTLGGQWVGFVVQLVTTVALARLLSPTDFGLLGMALTLTVFADQFRSLGLSQAVVQYEKLTLRQVNALFWVNLLAGLALALVVAAAAPLLAGFYGRAELVPMCLVLSSTYVLSGLAVQPSALLARRLSFRALALRTSLARLGASAVAITAAALGAGYWALVAQQVAVAALSCLFVWLAVTWRPGLPRGIREVGPLLRFGAGVTAGELMNTLARNGDNVLIGRFLGAAPLGLYTRAYSLLMLPLRQLKTPLGTVVQPMLAALRDEPDRYRRLYCATISGLAHLGMPLVAGMAVCSADLISVLLGERWLPAAGIFRYLAIAGVVQMVSGTGGWLLITRGNSAAYARMSFVTGVTTVLSFLAGLPWGAQGVAAAYAAGQIVVAVPSFWYACRDAPVSVADILGAMRRPLAVVVVVSAAMVGAAVATSALPPYLRLGTCAVAGGMAWASTLLAWPAARAEVLQLVATVRKRAV